MTNHRQWLGREGEAQAALFLETRGYRIVARNVRVDRIEIYGSERTLSYEVFRDQLSWVEKDGSMTPVDIAPEDAYDVKNWRVEEDFVRAIREPDFKYYPSFEDGLHYMKAVQAIYDSIESGRRATPA